MGLPGCSLSTHRSNCPTAKRFSPTILTCIETCELARLSPPEPERIVERVRPCLERARTQGKRLGRPHPFRLNACRWSRICPRRMPPQRSVSRARRSGAGAGLIKPSRRLPSFRLDSPAFPDPRSPWCKSDATKVPVAVAHSFPAKVSSIPWSCSRGSHFPRTMTPMSCFR